MSQSLPSWSPLVGTMTALCTPLHQAPFGLLPYGLAPPPPPDRHLAPCLPILLYLSFLPEGMPGHTLACPFRSVVSSTPSFIDLFHLYSFPLFLLWKSHLPNAPGNREPCHCHMLTPCTLPATGLARKRPSKWPPSLKEHPYLPLTLVWLPWARDPACCSGCVSAGLLLALHAGM